MNFEQIKESVLALSGEDQKRLILELVPEIWPMACIDDACIERMRELVDEETVKNYREQHFNTI